MGMTEPLVISASRRTDLVDCYPEVLAARLREFPAGGVHSVVIWTKNPKNMIEKGPLREILESYRQIFVHLTITGMGGGEFEPMIPPWIEIVKMIEPLIEIAGGPQRVSWRFDPILQAEGHGKLYSNLDMFPRLAEAVAPFGIKSCRVSWVSPYKKVLTRLARRGWRLVVSTREEKKTQGGELNRTARKYGMEIYFCSMEGFPVSSCIDGALLSQIHPDGLECSKEKAKGQRLLCGCTHSLDIGWYSLRCRNGCVYCYALP